MVVANIHFDYCRSEGSVWASMALLWCAGMMWSSPALSFILGIFVAHDIQTVVLKHESASVWLVTVCGDGWHVGWFGCHSFLLNVSVGFLCSDRIVSSVCWVPVQLTQRLRVAWFCTKCGFDKLSHSQITSSSLQVVKSLTPPHCYGVCIIWVLVKCSI